MGQEMGNTGWKQTQGRCSEDTASLHEAPPENVLSLTRWELILAMKICKTKTRGEDKKKETSKKNQNKTKKQQLNIQAKCV